MRPVRPLLIARSEARAPSEAHSPGNMPPANEDTADNEVSDRAAATLTLHPPAATVRAGG
jgi:hypothetical protein